MTRRRNLLSYYQEPTPLPSPLTPHYVSSIEEKANLCHSHSSFVILTIPKYRNMFARVMEGKLCFEAE